MVVKVHIQLIGRVSGLHLRHSGLSISRPHAARVNMGYSYDVSVPEDRS